MNVMRRYDLVDIRASITDEGYLVDTPVVGRVGIQVYRRADGSIVRELRLPDEVFDRESLASFAGKPITDEHPIDPVNAKNARDVTVGVIQGEGIRSGDNVIAPVIIHDGAVIDKIVSGEKRELSLGYTVTLDETPGVWNGQEYDAIQRNIRINHLAVVPRGRAGNARLNLDRHDAVLVNVNEGALGMSDNFGRVRLDNGLEYQAEPEVVIEIDRLRGDNAAMADQISELTRKLDSVTAERDTSAISGNVC